MKPTIACGFCILDIGTRDHRWSSLIFIIESSPPMFHMKPTIACGFHILDISTRDHHWSSLPYNPYLAHRALSKLEFPIGNIYCIIPKERTPLPLQLSTIINSISHEVGQNSIILKQIYTKVLSKQQNFIDAMHQ